ncbi:hypothetical protein VNI00_009457 [Paramarasmius palmivorus]|uniref:MFS general substrate transporter n=1 Tax=Paramarasmius palmivorus TaxID=297713 RepID=A0AAW0CLN7_9AGAR
MADGENQPLLQPRDSQTRQRQWFSLKSYSPVSLVIPVILGCRLANQLPQTTAVYLIQQLICRQYYIRNDPNKVPEQGPMPDELCSAPDVRELYTLVLTITGVVGGLGSLVGFNILGVLSARFGRRPAMLGTVMVALASNLFLITSQFMGEILEIVWLILWVLLDSVSGAYLMLFLVNTYVVDVVDHEARTAALSTLNGWAQLGEYIDLLCVIEMLNDFIGDGISFLAGGNITTLTNKILPVYYVSATIQGVALMYIAFILPESFPREKREALRREREEEAARIAASRAHMSLPQRIAATIGSNLGPLKNLKPTYNEHTGRRNWRLIILSIHILLAMASAGHIGAALVIYLTSIYNYKPADTGYALALYSLSGTFTMAFIIPLIIKCLRPLYKRRNQTTQDVRVDQQTDDETTDYLDVHVTMISWIIEAVGPILVAISGTRLGQYSAIVFMGVSSARNPVFRSLVAGSVEPLKQGETLAAIEMVYSFGLFVSPFIMGTILTSTIATAPSVVFWVNAVIATCAALLLLLVKDSDRYRSPAEEERRSI